MSNDTANDVVHLKAGEHLPAVPDTSPTTEMLKQLIEQMLENERRRLRNEYVRISMLFLLLLAVAIGSGLWFTRSLLDQLRTERQMAEHSMQALLQRDAQTRDQGIEDRDQRSEVRGQGPAIRNQQSEISNTSRADTNTVQAQADIQRILADLDAKRRALTDMLQSQNALTKNLLQSRDNELQILHERMKEVQNKIMNAAPPEALPIQEAKVPPKAQPLKETKAPPAIEDVAVDSLTVTTSNAVTLRLPIPAP